jgi:hypothetical protein
LWEAFLLQMNEFDRFLEVELRLMLDPVVVARPPTRGGLRGPRKPVLAVVPPTIELPADPVGQVEPVTVAVTVTPAHTI